MSGMPRRQGREKPTLVQAIRRLITYKEFLDNFLKLTKSQSALDYHLGTGILNNISIKYSHSLKQASLSCHLHPLG